MFAYSNKKNFLVEFCMFNEETTQGNVDRSRSMDYGGNIKRITTHKTWLFVYGIIPLSLVVGLHLFFVINIQIRA